MYSGVDEDGEVTKDVESKHGTHGMVQSVKHSNKSTLNTP